MRPEQRLPEGDVPTPMGSGLSKSAASLRGAVGGVVHAMREVMAGGRTAGEDKRQDRFPRRQGRDRAARLRNFEGKEQDWLDKWAINRMLINVSPRKFTRFSPVCFAWLLASRPLAGGWITMRERSLAHEGVGSVRPLRP
jgi:hypothetical protein